MCLEAKISFSAENQCSVTKFPEPNYALDVLEWHLAQLLQVKRS